MYIRRHINLALVILFINILVISETVDEFKTDDMVIDIDDDDEAAIQSYKEKKRNRPIVFQEKNNRIVGGNKTTIEEYAFIVSLQQIPDSHICGGSILSTLWVVSASHCISECITDPCIREVVKHPTEYQIVAGASDAKPMDWGQVREIETFIKHPGFGRPLLHNDIALIKVKNPFELSKSVKPIAVADVSVMRGRDVSQKFKNCLALGWGAQKPRSGKSPEDLTQQEKKDIEDDRVAPILMVVALPVLPIKLCKYLINDKYITNRHLCTMYAQGGRDACEGDSGGPLVCGKEPLLYGVTSWGHGCARRNTPGIFTRVDTYKAWIQNVMNGGPNIDYYNNSSNKLAFLNLILFLNIFQLIGVI